MSLLIHRAERADHLVQALGALLSDPLPDPFATEIVSVPTPGVERWLSQRLAARLGSRPGHSDGVCAAVDFCSPRRLVARALAGTGAAADEDDPWRPDHLVWPLLGLLDGSRHQPWARLLWCHLNGRAGRRWSLARHQAELFAEYAATRPAMLRAWSEHRDVDSAGQSLGPDWAWQAELWRRLRAVVDLPEPAERVAAAVQELQDRPDAADLPARLSLFGATRLEPHHVTVLTALSGGKRSPQGLSGVGSASKCCAMASRLVRAMFARRSTGARSTREGHSVGDNSSDSSAVSQPGTVPDAASASRPARARTRSCAWG